MQRSDLDQALEDAWGSLESLLDPDTAAFGRRVFESPTQRYVDRLAAVGLAGRGHVLDAGCGFGQWSLALQQLNERVTAVDTASDRLFVLRHVANALGLPIDTRYASLTDLPYPDGHFGAVFCYGVIFCTPWRESLTELVRVLAPGGRLYVNANEIGWTVNQWRKRPNASASFDPRESAARALQNTLDYERTGTHRGGQILIPQQELCESLRAAKLDVVAVGAEGSLHLDPAAPSPSPFFAGEYEGLPGVYEIVADRPR